MGSVRGDAKQHGDLVRPGLLATWRLMTGPESQVGFPVDLRETNDALELKASIPGVSPDDVNISMTPETLTIECQQPASEDDGGHRQIVREIARGRFQRSFNF